MKIEKINDNQIRCTLTSDDLANREIKLSELAYGTEKAKNLFQDMMQQAQSEFGFDSDNSPLMVEAIPVSPDSIVLIITKVDDPEELDTRFSKFAPDGNDSTAADLPQITGADDIIDVFHKLTEAKNKLQELKKDGKSSQPKKLEAPVDLMHAFAFKSLDEAILAAHGINGYFTGENSLYKNARQGTYQLVLHQAGSTPEDFNKVCNILSEYGTGTTFSAVSEAYLREHDNLIIGDQALQQLINL
ncbi:adaptor protein MecA [Novisyntrophococcus fermenticellae]|uniref:adaptor protein MecA n=1 Tax=Novisyntrophococcus fermenticellae TaxID=2068655 RepID=UPI001E2EC6A3|nr:adaptor protein MecA [Novisyntrophococcus fermenticellae]